MRHYAGGSGSDRTFRSDRICARGSPWGPTDWSSHTTSYAAWHACHVELRALHPHQQEDCDTLCSMPAVEICAMTMSRRVV